MDMKLHYLVSLTKLAVYEAYKQFTNARHVYINYTREDTEFQITGITYL
jgi:hypothetical protein